MEINSKECHGFSFYFLVGGGQEVLYSVDSVFLHTISYYLLSNWKSKTSVG